MILVKPLVLTLKLAMNLDIEPGLMIIFNVSMSKNKYSNKLSMKALEERYEKHGFCVFFLFLHFPQYL